MRQGIMKKRIAQTIIVLLVIVSICTGCAANADPSSEQYSTLKEILKNYKDDLNAEFDNLVLPSSITLDQTDALYTFTRTQPSKPTKDEASTVLVGAAKDMLNWEINPSEIKCEEGLGGDEYSVTSEDGSLYVGYPCRYGIYLRDDPMTDIDTSYKPESVFKAIHIDRNELTAEYEGVVEECNKKLETLRPYLCPDISYRAKELFLLGDDPGTPSFMIVYEACFKGIPLDSSCDYVMAGSGFSKPTSLVMRINNDKKLSDVVVFYPDEYKMPAAKCEDRFLTLKAAAEIVSDYLAKYRQFGVLDIEMSYVCITSVPMGGYAPEGDYRPMWKFVLRERVLSERTLAIPQQQMCAYVDMQTGEIYVVDNIDQNVYFDLSDGED